MGSRPSGCADILSWNWRMHSFPANRMVAHNCFFHSLITPSNHLSGFYFIHHFHWYVATASGAPKLVIIHTTVLVSVNDLQNVSSLFCNNSMICNWIWSIRLFRTRMSLRVNVHILLLQWYQMNSKDKLNHSQPDELLLDHIALGLSSRVQKLKSY